MEKEIEEIKKLIQYLNQMRRIKMLNINGRIFRETTIDIDLDYFNECKPEVGTHLALFTEDSNIIDVIGDYFEKPCWN
jgi:hypothetical protein